MQYAYENQDFNSKIVPISRFFYDGGVRIRYGFNGEENTDIAESGNYDCSAVIYQMNEEIIKQSGGRSSFVLLHGSIHTMPFDENRFVVFDSLLHYLSELDDCKVVLTTMPYQPAFIELLKELEDFDARKKYFIEKIKLISSKYPNVVLFQDNTEISDFDGTANHFFDNCHITSVNSTLIIKSLEAEMSEDL
ncbi:MAG: hypothetical protein HRT71_13210 [Flavobacteriales bacterium]|nr:hypothetical protein [Flavobacteriales bacterium]